MSNIDKQALRERHTFHIAPHCHICGTKMTIARMQAGRFEYACSGCTYDDNGAHYALGRSLGDEHYSASYVTIHDLSDPDVIKVLDELEAAEKRIAELEAKLQTADKLQDSAFRHGLQHGFSLGQTDNQAGFEECLSAYGSRGKDNG